MLFVLRIVTSLLLTILQLLRLLRSVILSKFEHQKLIKKNVPRCHLL